MDFFRDIDNWVFGGARSNRRMKEEQHEKNMKRIQALIDSAEGQNLLMKARAAALDRGEGYYGGRGIDPYVKGAEDLGKIRKARDSFLNVDEKGKPLYELSPETAAYFDAAEKSVLARMKPKVERNLRLEGQLPVDADEGLFDRIGPGIPITDNRHYFAPGEELYEVSKELGKPALSDYFQASTPTVPEEKIPKTFAQLGITNVDDMQTLQEMQEALPEVDMRQEYESDPELMKKLIELWRAKKLNKSNLHKAFSRIQESAQKKLGIR